MFKFHVAFVFLCVIQISNAGGIYKNIKSIFRKQRKFGEKEYALKKNDLVKITNGTGKGKVGQIGLTEVNQEEWLIKLHTGETVYSKPENLMIVNTVNDGLFRLTPYDSEVQLWGNENDLVMDVPPNIDEPWVPEAKKVQNLLRKKDLKKLLNFLLKNPIYVLDLRLEAPSILHFPKKQSVQIPLPLRDALLTALASRMTAHELKNGIVEAYGIKHGYYLHPEYTLLRIVVKLGNVALMARILDEVQLRGHAVTLVWPLEIAVREKNEKMCEFLLQNGFIMNGRGTYGWTPLMHSIRKKSEGCFKAIINNKDVDINSQARHDDRTALHFAAGSGTGEMCEALVAKHANIDEMADIGTPLMVAAEYGNIECLRVLLKSKANISVKTALMIAVKKGNTNCMKELLKHTANEDIPRAIAIAKEQGRDDYADYLRRFQYRLILVHQKAIGNGKSLQQKQKNITNAIKI